MLQVIEYSISAGTEDNPNASFSDSWDSLKIPELKLPEHAYGSTGYLDGLESEDMTSPAMKGVDRTDRKFVAVRARVTLLKEKGSELVPAEDPYVREGVEVFFQRYTSDQDYWTCGGDLRLMDSNMCESDKSFLEKLLKDGRTVHVKITNMKGGRQYTLVELI